MNEVIKAIHERRSIRHFRSEPVSERDLAAVIEAGLYAPSARNCQAWHILALCRKEDIARLNEGVKKASKVPGFDAYDAFVNNSSYTINYAGAPVFVVVSVDHARSNFPDADGALVLGNMMLAAHSLGLGSCWINQLKPIGREPGFRALLLELGMPAANDICGCLALGRPAGAHPKAPARAEGTATVVR